MGNLKNDLTITMNQDNEAIEVLTVPELAEYLNIGKNRTYELLNQGVIKGFRIGSTWRIGIAAVNAYIREASGL